MNTNQNFEKTLLELLAEMRETEKRAIESLDRQIEIETTINREVSNAELVKDNN